MGRIAYPFRLGGPAAASLLVNALLIAALFSLGMGRADRRTDSPTLTILSLAVLKGVEQGEEDATAANVQTASAASPVEPPPDHPRPPMAQPTTVLADKAPSVLRPPMPVMAMAVSDTAKTNSAISAPKGTFATAPAAPPARRGVADGLDANAPPGTSRSYAAKIRSWLYAHKIYPRRARMRHEEGMVQVRFVIDRAGMLIEGVVVRGSGNGTLDGEAAAMMQRASPFPKAPSDVPGDRIEFIAPIEFVLPV